MRDSIGLEGNNPSGRKILEKSTRLLNPNRYTLSVYYQRSDYRYEWNM